jgi:hypothetical protein
MTKFQALFARFWKGFLTGGLGSVVALVNSGVSFSTMDEFANFGFALLSAFVTGGALALWKLVTWKP